MHHFNFAHAQCEPMQDTHGMQYMHYLQYMQYVHGMQGMCAPP